jgi:hypothetical protein
MSASLTKLQFDLLEYIADTKSKMTYKFICSYMGKHCHHELKALERKGILKKHLPDSAETSMWNGVHLTSKGFKVLRQERFLRFAE